MFLTADILLCHLVGDYAIQSDYMAVNKTKSSVPALAHALTYTIPFLFLTTSWKALLFIAGTHFLIDRFRLARYLVWAKNFLAPRWIDVPKAWVCSACGKAEDKEREVLCWSCGKGVMVYHAPQKIHNHPWSECSGTGYFKGRDLWLTVWLLIIVDNTAHLVCNAAALRWL